MAWQPVLWSDWWQQNYRQSGIEYSRCIEKYLQPDDRYISCIFGELEESKVVQKVVYTKMDRGEMLLFMAGLQAETPEKIKALNWSWYHYKQDCSSDYEYFSCKPKYQEKERNEKVR